MRTEKQGCGVSTSTVARITKEKGSRQFFKTTPEPCIKGQQMEVREVNQGESTWVS